MLLQDLAYLDSSGAQLQKGTCPRPAEDSRYTLKLYLQTLSLSLSVAVYQCIGLFIYTHLLYIYAGKGTLWNWYHMMATHRFGASDKSTVSAWRTASAEQKLYVPDFVLSIVSSCIIFIHRLDFVLCMLFPTFQKMYIVRPLVPSAQVSLRSSSSLFQSCPANATWHCLKLCPATQPKGKSSCSTTGTHTQRKYEKVQVGQKWQLHCFSVAHPCEIFWSNQFQPLLDGSQPYR